MGVSLLQGPASPGIPIHPRGGGSAAIGSRSLHMSLINAVRGEVRALLGGAPRTLCLTLGALAELESAFGVDGLPALAERLRRLSAA
ncbi:MAG TPA: GTA-gp10 family protein, partial [Phenylobacterium sp.]|nr:GTA-gp10 family protein [Phenylobacterium sp.]